MNHGIITAISGPVVDVAFSHGQLPRIHSALSVTVKGKERIMEVAQHIGNDTVRCIMLAASEDLARGMDVTDPGTGIRVPVGDQTLG